MKNILEDIRKALDGFPYEPPPEQIRIMVSDETGRVHSLNAIKHAVETLRRSNSCRCLS